MLADLLQLVSGLALLVVGGEAMVRGAAALARQLGVPSLIVGLTVVAFGTSAPELAVNVTAAVRGSGAVAFGNVIGSNLANIGLILAASAFVRPLAVQSVVITREIPMMLLATAAAVVMASDGLRMQSVPLYDRAEGLLFLLLFGVFLFYTIGETLTKRGTDPFLEQAGEVGVSGRLRSAGASGAVMAVGLLGLVLGGELTVRGAVDVAASLGAPKELIGLTVVAIGTSLPELSTSVLAARRGETDLAVGNVVGSNIFNLLFILGATAVVRPVPVPPGGHADLAAAIAFAAILLALCVRDREIGRLEGVLLISTYVGYFVWRTG